VRWTAGREAKGETVLADHSSTVVLAVETSAHQSHLAAAAMLAVASAGCYAASAALQHRYASRPADDGHPNLLVRLVYQPGWWLGGAAMLAGALLHVGALALGPLIVVQPLGVSELLLALPLGAALSRRMVTRTEWTAAAAVVLGLSALLAIAPHEAPEPYFSPRTVELAELGVGALVLALLVLALRLPDPAVPVVRAVAAAVCFGNASVMAQVAVTGTGSLPLAASMTVLFGAAGIGTTQLAYRDGGLGAPLAAQALIDPLVGVAMGVTLLGEPLMLTPARATLGSAGVIITALGICALAARRDGQDRDSQYRASVGPPAFHEPLTEKSSV
jgi:hypothetical protein